MKPLPTELRVEVSGLAVTLALRRSPRAKWTKILAMTDRLEVVLPARATLKDASEIVRRHEAWVLTNHLSLQTRLKRHAEGGVWFEGERYRFEPADGPVFWDRDGHVVRAPSEDAVRAWLWVEAAARLRDSVARWSEVMGVRPVRVTIRNQRTRWGSCSTSGAVSLNVRLLMARPASLEYVVVHELAHLRHPNHSADFWAEVARHFPAYREEEKWLKDYYADIKAVFGGS